MISLIEALNFRCLRYVRQPLRPFHVLVGPNASGKTTFLDVVAFLHELVANGLDEAVVSRTANFSDLVWWHAGTGFELAVEAPIPAPQRDRLEDARFDTIRYEVAIRRDTESEPVEIVAEQAFLKVGGSAEARQKSLFPMPDQAPDTLITTGGRRNTRRLFSKTHGGNDNYYAEAHRKVGRWQPAFKLGSRKSTLANLPEDETNFPVSTWFKQLISDGVERILLNSLQMRQASPPGQGSGFKPDGSNIPWVVADLARSSPERLAEWVRHLQTALPDLAAVKAIERDDDRHCYLRLVYEGDLDVPSWMVSDGTLRLLALTLPAYLDQLKGIFLIEEPENGIHPLAIETMYQSLSSVYDAQVLMATHSPVILGIAEPENVLCFAKTTEGAVDIVTGREHPRLRDWRGEVDLGTLFASGVLG
jgi:predicted ATPase